MGYWGKLLGLPRWVPRKSPTTWTFLAGLHIRDAVDKRLDGRAVAVSITPTKGDIIQFLRARVEDDTIPDAMDKSLQEDIMNSIPETV